MYIWTCKKCGQSFDDMFCGDYICDDCFDKMKKEEKKQKQRNTPFFRFLSLALVLSFMLCIFSGFGVAHAESSSEMTDTTYKGYTVFQCTTNSSIRLDTLYNFHKNNYSEYRQLILYLIYFDENGNIHYYCNHPNASHLDFCTLYDVDETSSSACAYDVGFLSGKYYVGTSLDSYDLGSNNTTFHFGQVYGMEYPHIFRSYNNGVNLITGGSPYHDGSSTNFPLFDDNTTYYFVPVPYDNANGLNEAYYRNLLIDNGSQSDLVTKVAPTYTAKFHNFASANDNVGGVQEILNMIDWIGLGNQYPTVDFSINDAGNNHSYSLRISSNKNYVDVCMALWEDYKLKRLVETSSSAIALAFTPDIISKFVIASSNGKIDGFGISINNSNVADAVRYLAQVNLLKSIGDLSYVTEYNLTSPYLQFNEGESPARAYSVCLPDYVTITKGLVYRLDIVDNYTGMILDTAYFCNDTTFAKTNTGYGTKVYNYSDYNDLLGDVDGDNGYVNNDSYTQGDSLQSDNPNDIVDWDKYNQYDFTNIQNLTGTLNSATAGLGGFFMACYNIIPPVFVSILLGTFTLVIILRVLGR